MQVIKSPAEIHNQIEAYRKQGFSVGLVPTMGALHEGHFTLIRRSVAENNIVVVSIFVNPLQFNDENDLKAYPRTLREDLEVLESLGCTIAYLPDQKLMYPETPRVSIGFGEMDRVMEGKFRPGHFAGVGVVVIKLFNHVMPHKAYFGLKDLQQFLLIERMVKDLSIPVEVIGVSTVRAENGLALSSRNKRLSESGKVVASNIFRGLDRAGQMIRAGVSVNETKSAVIAFYNSVEGLEIEYMEIVDARNLQAFTSDRPNYPLAVCVAGYVEGIRLIDNLYLRQD